VQTLVTWLVGTRRGASLGLAATDALILTKSEPELLRDLRQDGFALGVNLSSRACAELMHYCNDSTFIANGTKRAVRPHEFHGELNSYIFRRGNPHLDCQLVKSLAQDSRLVRLVAKYLGTTPILHNTQIWFSLPPGDVSKEESNPEFGFHYDIDDFRFVKFFFYLTDVNMSAGPHVAIPGSHNDYSLAKKLKRRLPPANAAQFGEPFVFTGPAGTGFAEDTSIYHKASVPTMSRAILQIEYSLTIVLRKLEQRHVA
jgi:hypothetical protein